MINSKGSTTEKSYTFLSSTKNVLFKNNFISIVVNNKEQRLERGEEGHQEALTYLENRRHHAVI